MEPPEKSSKDLVLFTELLVKISKGTATTDELRLFCEIVGFTVEEDIVGGIEIVKIKNADGQLVILATRPLSN